MNTHVPFDVMRLPDDALLSRVKQLAAREREATVALIAHLAELDVRRLYLAEGCSSLFTYCTQVLHLSEHAAYGRIEAARAARRFPVVLELLEEGALTLTSVCLLGSHLTEENHRAVLDAARYQSKRQVEELVARLDPQPPIPSSIRRLPAPRSSVIPPSPLECSLDAGAELGAGGLFPDPTITHSAPPHPSVVAPLAPEHYRVQFTASREMHEKLRLAQSLLRHQIPSGDPAAIFDRALTLLLDTLMKEKLAATNRPRQHQRELPGSAASSRHTPAEVRRAVWRRDGGRCAFVSATGRRCTARGFLEFHHVVPFSAGGVASVDNIQLRCRAHNGYEAERARGGVEGGPVRGDKVGAVLPKTLRLPETLFPVSTRSGPSNMPPL